MAIRQVFLLIAWLLAAISSLCAQHYLRYPYERLIRMGDHREWAAPGLDDRDWDKSGSTRETGNFWVRFKVRCDSITDTYSVPGMQVISLGSYEAYWDGVLIGKNGVVGTTLKTEIPGTFLSWLPVPDSLTRHGVHTVAFRVSNHHAPHWGISSWNLFYLEEYRLTQVGDLKLTARIFVLAGIYLMAGLYYLFLYLFRKREWVGLIFSGICFLFFGLVAMEYLKFLYAYPYPFHYTRLMIIYGITFLLAFLVPRFLLLYFDLPHKMIWSLVSTGVLVMISLLFLPGTDSSSQFLAGGMWLISLSIAFAAVIRMRPESKLILAVLIGIGALNGLYHMAFRSLLFTYDITVFVSFSILVIAMMYLLAMRSREQKRAYESSLVLSSRLQNELLRKHIQPHFIMNTLTSLMEWVEESPNDSVRFIEALSGEFEIFSAIADKKLIPIEQEIRLCRYHLEIMKYRKEVDYQLEITGINPEETIPPAILHTLVENGIMHSLPDKENRIRMKLSFRQTDRSRCYELKTVSLARKKGNTADGTGFRYIKSRLTENYGDRWQLDARPIPEGWVTTITIDNAAQ